MEHDLPGQNIADDSIESERINIGDSPKWYRRQWFITFVSLIIFSMCSAAYKQCNRSEYKYSDLQESRQGTSDQNRVSEDSTYKMLLSIVNEVNKTMPKQLSKDMRIDCISALPPNEIIYKCTMNVSKKGFDYVADSTAFAPVLLNNIKTSPSIRTFREMHTTMSYMYYDKAGNYLYKISVTPAMYMGN